MIKAVTAATVLVFLLATTPYPYIFSFLQAFLPSVFVDVLFLTYRSFFILLEQISHVITAIKIRGGFSSKRVISHLTNLSSIFGHTFIHAFRLNERLQGIMYIRGYNGKIAVTPKWHEISPYDFLPLALGIIFLSGAIAL
jgi:cobalt/nickel transport system permease protein